MGSRKHGRSGHATKSPHFRLWANGDRPVHCLEIDGQGAQRHRDGSRPADLDDAIDTATIGQLTGLRVPVRRLGVVDHVRGAQSLPYPGGGSFRPPNQSQTA